MVRSSANPAGMIVAIIIPTFCFIICFTICMVGISLGLRYLQMKMMYSAIGARTNAMAAQPLPNYQAFNQPY
jgi:hypothetical protein